MDTASGGCSMAVKAPRSLQNARGHTQLGAAADAACIPGGSGQAAPHAGAGAMNVESGALASSVGRRGDVGDAPLSIAARDISACGGEATSDGTTTHDTGA